LIDIGARTKFNQRTGKNVMDYTELAECTLRHKILTIIHDALVRNGYKRAQTARELNIPVRSLFNYIVEIKKRNMKFGETVPAIPTNENFSKTGPRIFPTNQERLNYLNKPTQHFRAKGFKA
jgi:hypothetical protein